MRQMNSIKVVDWIYKVAHSKMEFFYFNKKDEGNHKKQLW